MAMASGCGASGSSGVAPKVAVRTLIGIAVRKQKYEVAIKVKIL